MGKKSEKQNGAEPKEEENEKKEKGGGGNVTVVLKADLHCKGCAHKVMKSIRSFDGVDAVTIGDDQKITVVGLMDPAKLREKVEKKTHKKVELISPALKKGGGDNKEKNAEGKENASGGNGKQAEKKQKEEAKERPSKDKSDEKKPKEKQMPVITAVFKVNLHCDGCIQRIYKTVIKTKGYEDMKIDKQKDLVTVTGAIDMKALGEVLQKQLKKPVEIVPNKKEGEKKGGGGGAGAGAAAAANKGGDRTEEKMEGNKLQTPMVGYPYPFMYGSVIGDQLHYNPYAVHSYHAPQIFSDENPHACSVM